METCMPVKLQVQQALVRNKQTCLHMLLPTASNAGLCCKPISVQNCQATYQYAYLPACLLPDLPTHLSRLISAASMIDDQSPNNLHHRRISCTHNPPFSISHSFVTLLWLMINHLTLFIITACPALTTLLYPIHTALPHRSLGYGYQSAWAIQEKTGSHILRIRCHIAGLSALYIEPHSHLSKNCRRLWCRQNHPRDHFLSPPILEEASLHNSTVFTRTAPNVWWRVLSHSSVNKGGIVQYPTTFTSWLQNSQSTKADNTRSSWLLALLSLGVIILLNCYVHCLESCDVLMMSVLPQAHSRQCSVVGWRSLEGCKLRHVFCRNVLPPIIRSKEAGHKSHSQTWAGFKRNTWRTYFWLKHMCVYASLCALGGEDAFTRSHECMCACAHVHMGFACLTVRVKILWVFACLTVLVKILWVSRAPSIQTIRAKGFRVLTIKAVVVQVHVIHPGQISPGPRQWPCNKAGPVWPPSPLTPYMSLIHAMDNRACMVTPAELITTYSKDAVKNQNLHQSVELSWPCPVIFITSPARQWQGSCSLISSFQPDSFSSGFPTERGVWIIPIYIHTIGILT